MISRIPFVSFLAKTTTIWTILPPLSFITRDLSKNKFHLTQSERLGTSRKLARAV